MSRSIIILSVLALLQSVSVGAESTEDLVQRYIQPLVEDRDYGGVCVAVFRDGERFEGVFEGEKSSGTLKMDSIFEAGSITKVFTSTMLAELVDEGKARWTDPAEDHLPEGVNLPKSGNRDITLIDLATHCSGLPRMPWVFDPADSKNPYADYDVDKLCEGLSNQEELKRDVGAGFEYSNFGYAILGTILTRIESKPYSELLRERICEPLGIKDAWVIVPEDQKDRYVHGYRKNGEPVPHWDFLAFQGAGSIRTTPRALLKFLEAEMHPPQDELGRAMRLTHQPTRRAVFDTMFIGLGWHVKRLGDHEMILHNGQTGGFASFAAFIEDSNVALVLMNNCSNDIALTKTGFQMMADLAE